ncbi:hypothetical protein C0J52_07408 [Blattella germanica]|nr:hypothetical protein C0J52_07408 [Blattella germanica]
MRRVLDKAYFSHFHGKDEKKKIDTRKRGQILGATALGGSWPTSRLLASESHMSLDMEVNLHPTSERVTCGKLQLLRSSLSQP